MGLFSNPKCPIHRTEYSIGTNGLEDYYYCKQCKAELIEKRNKELKQKSEMEELRKRIAELEKQLTNERRMK